MNVFYLFPEDLGDEPLSYECTFQKKVVLTDSQEEVWLVEVNPSLPNWIGNSLPDYEPKMLGLVAVHKSWTLKRVGEFGFVVDVLVIRNRGMISEKAISSAFCHFGTGVIGATSIKPRLK